MKGYGGMVIAALAGYVVEARYGPIGLTRLFGALFLLFAVWGIWAPSIAVSAGRYPVGNLSGWKKAFALVPAAAIGLLMILYAPQITCFGSRYQHLCS